MESRTIVLCSESTHAIIFFVTRRGRDRNRHNPTPDLESQGLFGWLVVKAHFLSLMKGSWNETSWLLPRGRARLSSFPYFRDCRASKLPFLPRKDVQDIQVPGLIIAPAGHN